MRPLWCLTYYSLVQHSIVKFFYSLNIFLNSMTGKNDKGLLASVKSSSYRTDGTVKVGVGGVLRGVPTWTFLGQESICNSGNKIENCLANISRDYSKGTASFFLLPNIEKLLINLELTQDCLKGMKLIWEAFDCKPMIQWVSYRLFYHIKHTNHK